MIKIEPKTSPYTKILEISFQKNDIERLVAEFEDFQNWKSSTDSNLINESKEKLPTIYNLIKEIINSKQLC